MPIKRSTKIGISFGITSGVITTLGLIVGLNSGTGSIAAVIGGIFAVAIADGLSDALGIHMTQEARPETSRRAIWRSTISAFLTNFLFALSFAIPILLLPLNTAVWISVAYGFIVLAVLSYYIAKTRGGKPLNAIAEHLLIAAIVVAATHFTGLWVGSYFS
jgi:VIT1/CCC1 family predicted Fe2+/Mn2+ transporter